MKVTLTIVAEADDEELLRLLPDSTGSLTREQLQDTCIWDSLEVFYAHRQETTAEARERRADDYYDEEFA